MPFLAPLGAAIGAAFAGAASWLAGGSLLAGLVKAGIGIVAQYLVGKFLGPKQEAQAVKLETTYGDKQPRQIALGYCGMKGHHIFRNASGSGNRRIQDVFEFSCFPVTAFTRFLVEGQWRLKAESQTSPYGYRLNSIEPAIYVRPYYGSLVQAADARLIASDARWTEDHVGAGVSYLVVESHLDREKLTSPWEPTVEIKGAPLYDWRLDTSVGGSGSHRWNDQSTWEFSENPVLMMYALERGFYHGTELMVGKGTPASRLPLAEWTTAANICDEDINGSPRYRAGLIALSGQGVTHDANMQPLLNSCAASWIEDANGEYPIVGAVQAVAGTFTDDDIMPGQPFRFSAFRPKSELVNTVTGSYPEPEVFYEAKQFAARIDISALGIDRERLAVAIDYGAVPYSVNVDRLADIAIRSTRFQANAEICLKPKWLQIKPGRWYTWNSAKYGSRKFLVVSKRLGAMGSNAARLVYVTLQEVGDGVYDPTAYETLPPPTTLPGTPEYASEASNFVGVAIGFSTDGGEAIPGLQFTWNAFDDITVVAVEVEYRKVGTTDSIIKTAAVPLQIIRTADGVLSDSDFEYRHRIITSPPRTTSYTDWTELHTITAVTGISIGLANLQPVLYQTIQQLNQELDAVRATLEQIALAAAEGAGTVAEQRSVAVRFQNATAAVLNQQTASISVINGELVALAEDIAAVEAGVGNVLASGLLRLTAEAGSGDVVSRVVAQVRATIEDDWVSAGWFIEAGFTGGDPGQPFSRYVVNADQFIVTDGAAEASPLVFEDGVLKLAVARIGSAIIEQFTTANGKLTINGSGTDSDISIIV